MFVTLRVNPGQDIPAGYDVICHGAMKDMDAELRYFLNPDARDTANKILTEANAALDQLNECYDRLELDREQHRADRQKLRDSAARLALSCDMLEQRYIARDRARAEAEARKLQEGRIKAALDTLEEREAETRHGELTTHPPSIPRQEEQFEAMEHPADDVEEQLHTGPSVLEDQGDLPNELLEKVPPDPGTDPELSGAREPTYRNPVGISMHSAHPRKANGHG
jgi:hypothetical protein